MGGACGQHEAAWYEREANSFVRCRLCPHECHIGPDRRGKCLGRVNYDGTLYAETYARPASIAMDPIEKKPLYHFAPGGQILSIGTYGCNLRCKFCQNCEISFQRTPTESLGIEELVTAAKARESIGIAFTYNEPVIWFEFVKDCAAACRTAGLSTVMVTNGFINPEPLEELLPLIDAMNIDLKSFRPEFYRDVCGGALEPVKATLKRAVKSCHVEITNLIIPGHNDGARECSDMAEWIAAELGAEVPFHLSAYSPRHQFQARPTSAADLAAIKPLFDKHLKYVYLGNIAIPGAADTVCPACHETAVRRVGYSVDPAGMTKDGRCAACKQTLGMHGLRNGQ